MDLTTEPFSQAELIYPIRYRYRSWFEPDQQIPLLVSEYLKTDEVNEEFLWFDHANQQGYRYVKQETAEEKEADLPGFVMEKVGITQGEQSLIAQSHQKRFTGNGIWDYLSLLHRLRVMELKPGQVFKLPVYNGKEVKQIQVKVEEEQLQELGWNRLAFKLSLTELRKGKARKDRSSLIWISNDEERLPLRFYTKRAFGVVDGILETGRPMMARHDAFSQKPEELQDLLRLRISPVGIKYFAKTTDIPDGFEVIKSDCTVCQVIAESRYHESPVATTKDAATVCGMGGAVSGFYEIAPDVADGTRNVGAWAKTVEATRKLAQNRMSIKTGTFEALGVAPLKSMSVEPDVVQVWGSPVQMLYRRHAGEKDPFVSKAESQQAYCPQIAGQRLLYDYEVRGLT